MTASPPLLPLLQTYYTNSSADERRELVEEEEDHTYELLLTAETKIPASIPESQSGKSKCVVKSFCFHTLFSSVLVRILKCCPNQASYSTFICIMCQISCLRTGATCNQIKLGGPLDHVLLMLMFFKLPLWVSSIIRFTSNAIKTSVSVRWSLITGAPSLPLLG